MQQRAPARTEVANRKRDLAEIHVLKKSLGLQEDEYRDLMATVCSGVRSSGDLDYSGRARFLAHLRLCARERGLSQPAAAKRPVKSPLTPQQRLMWSLWMQLADAGLIKQRTMAALESWAFRQTGVNKLTWLNTAQEDAVIAALRAWLKG